jgi:hypothetical protein
VSTGQLVSVSLTKDRYIAQAGDPFFIMCTTCIDIEYSLYSSTRDEARVPYTANLTYGRLNHVERGGVHLTQLGFCAGLPLHRAS